MWGHNLRVSLPENNCAFRLCLGALHCEGPASSAGAGTVLSFLWAADGDKVLSASSGFTWLTLLVSTTILGQHAFFCLPYKDVEAS